ncbi:MAG: VOC family protein [Verrucomicrobiota bacterium JB022]|nr:VOC family protein [Verrucomicrobiota bacterium JB022]
MKILGTDFFSYEVSDLARSIEFYRDLLGLKLTEDGSEHGFVEFDVPPSSLALIAAPIIMNRPPQPGGSMIWLAVPDMAAAVAELKERGVTVVMEPMETPVCFMCGFLDPDGNTIGLHQRKDGTAG